MREFFSEIKQMLEDSNMLYIIGAILILFIGWLIALWCGRVLSKMLHPLLCKRRTLPDGSEITVCSHADTWAGKLVYYAIMIFTLIACFSVLGLHEAADPLRAFANSIAAYAPRIVGALLLCFIAWISATIIRSISRMVLMRGKLYEHINRKLPEKKSDFSCGIHLANDVLHYTCTLSACHSERIENPRHHRTAPTHAR